MEISKENLGIVPLSFSVSSTNDDDEDSRHESLDQNRRATTASPSHPYILFDGAKRL